MKILWYSVLAAVVLAGCSDDKKPVNSNVGKKPDAVQEDKSAYTSLSNEAVLVQVGTNQLTKFELERLIDLQCRMYALKLPADQKDRRVSRKTVEIKLLSEAQMSYRSQLIQAKWAKENNVSVSDAELAEMKASIVNNSGVKCESFVEFLKKFTESERDTLLERAEKDALIAKVFKRFGEIHDEKPSEAMVKQFLDGVNDYNRKASATNAVVWTLATNIWKRAVSGENFADLASEYSAEGSFADDCLWGSFTTYDMRDNPELLKLLPDLQLNEYTPPVEADNGLCIVRLDRMVDGQGKDTVVRDSATRYMLSRVYLRLPEFYPVPNREEAFKELREGLHRKHFVEFMKGELAKDGAVYPSGEEIFKEARTARKMPLPIVQENGPVTVDMQKKE